MWYKKVEVIGLENLKKDVPIVISGTHNNMFIDAALMIYVSERPVNFIMAAVSKKQVVLRFFTQFLNVITTNRPIDFAFDGQGTITKIKEGVVEGKNTNFDEKVVAGGGLLLSGEFKERRVKEVISADKLILADTDFEVNEEITYKILPKTDQSVLFKNVLDALAQNEIIGIFPEGGSHDQSVLLPLKAGACIFNYSTFQKHKKNVNMVEMGFNYFGPHKSRSRVVINIGKPRIEDFNEELIEDKNYKRATIGRMLEDLKISLEDVKICAPTYKDLLNLYTAKELYIPDGEKVDPEQDFILYKKFAHAYYKLQDKPEVKTLKEETNYFRKEIKKHGLKMKELRDFENTFSTRTFQYLKKFLKYFILVF